MLPSRPAPAAVGVSLLAFLCLAAPARADDEPVKGGPRELKNIRYRPIGPAAGGRVSRSTGVPGNPRIYYAATASGGLWKSGDGGVTWKGVADELPTASFGAIALAPSDPNVLYAGSGEANIRGNVQRGNGIYRSTDAGRTWKHVWKQEGQIGQLIVHPANAAVAYAAVLGHAFGPNPERGVYRTRDGGTSWQKVLFKDPDTGAIDVCFDPSNPRILFAALWQARRRPWELTSGGPGSGLYRSGDEGESWQQLQGHGLPPGPWGRIGLAVGGPDGQRIYALIEADKGGLYRSDDGGNKWQLVNGQHYLRQRPWYFSTIHVDPTNANVLWCASVRLLKSIDGGRTFTKVKGPHHGDHHDLWIDPRDPRHLIDSNDGGVDISLDGGRSWFAPMLPISQFYHVSADTRVPYHVMGNMQDIGTAAGPSNSLTEEGIALSDWYEVGGGETGFAVADPKDPHVVYAGEYGGYISRFDFRTRQARNVSIYPFTTSGHAAAELRYRFQWTAPIVLSPNDPGVVYHAANVLFRTADGGRSWQKISPDLTRNDRSKQQWSGGPISGDNTGAEVYCTIFAVAESPRKKGLIWAGSDDGLVHLSSDGGRSWENVTENVPGLPEWGTVSCIEPSPLDERSAYLVVDAHRLDNMRPYLWKTSDGGKTWKDLTAHLPRDSYLHVVRADPHRPGLLFVGTEHGVCFSLDDGGTWQPLKLNLPTVAVTDLVVKGDDLVVGTSGRSVWILDDLTPVRQLDAGRAADVHLFPTRPALRWRYHHAVHSTAGRPPGKNPPQGAVLHYRLKAKTSDVRLTVHDSQGRLVRTLTSKKPPPEDDEPEDHPDAPGEKFEEPVLPTDPGIHRVFWDLSHQGPGRVRGVKLDMGQAPRRGPLVLPGTYEVRLTVGAKTLTTQLDILPDPRVTVPVAELQEQLRLTLTIRDDLDRLVEAITALRSLKRQLQGRQELLKDVPRAVGLLKDSKALLGKLDILEEKLHNPRAEVAYDILAQKGGAKLYSQLAMLFGTLQEADGAPSHGIREMAADLEKELNRLLAEWDQLQRQDMARLNELARALDAPGVWLAPPRKRR